MKKPLYSLFAALTAAVFLFLPIAGKSAETNGIAVDSSAPAAPSAAVFSENPEINAFIVNMRDAHGFDADELSRLFAGITPHPAVLQAILPPTVKGQRSWRVYRPRFVNPERIDGGVRFWRRHEADLARASARYGVPPEIIVAVIGVETLYGRNMGRFNVLRALASLAFYYPPRADYFRSELEQFLLFARENGIDPRTVTGSYAGAIGIPQFMPGSIRRFAVDFENKGYIDLRNSEIDAIGSVASFLYQHGWEKGKGGGKNGGEGGDGPVAVPATLKGDPAPLLALGILPQKTLAELAAQGFSAPGDPKRYAAVIDLETPGEETEYWAGFNNFYVITRYNRSSFYAMSVYQLAQAIIAARAENPDGIPEPAVRKTPRRQAARAKQRHRPQ